MSNISVRACLVGAGYISEFHKKALDNIDFAELVAVCDLNLENARNLVNDSKIDVYASVEDALLNGKDIDIFHILTPPNTHFSIAKQCIEAGKNVLLEKPATASSAELETLLDISKQNNVKIYVNHNFLSSSPTQKLHKTIQQRHLGPLKSIHLRWAQPLNQAIAGPWNLWMLQAPENNLYETGTHLLAALNYLLDSVVKVTNVVHGTPRRLANNKLFIDRWEIQAIHESTLITISIDSSACFEQHQIEAIGQFGLAIADIQQNIFLHKSHTGKSFDQETLFKNLRHGVSVLSQGFKTYTDYMGSKFHNRFSGSPYEQSMTTHIRTCLNDLANLESQKHVQLSFCSNIYAQIQQIADHISPTIPATLATSEAGKHSKKDKPEIKSMDVLVIGGSGFIGARLVSKLLNCGFKIGALVRNESSLMHLNQDPNLTILIGDYRDTTFLSDCLAKADRVIHLAVAHANSRPGYEAKFVKPTMDLISACQKTSITQFIYIGTIDSLPLSKPISLDNKSPLDQNLNRRNNYAYAKGAIENYLHSIDPQGMDWVILRPGIVLGQGGPVQHPGIGEWSGISQCHYWGQGDNRLPLILVDDVCDAITQAVNNDGISRQSLNLVADVQITAQEYVKIIEDALDIRITGTARSHAKRYIIDKLKWLLKLASSHQDKVRVPSYRDWQARGQYATFDNSQTKAALQWKPVESNEEFIRCITAAAQEQCKANAPLVNSRK